MGYALIFAVLFFPAAPAARAGEFDILLDRLVQKKVIDPGEALEIREGARGDAGNEGPHPPAVALPARRRTLTFVGDMRMRTVQWQRQHALHAAPGPLGQPAVRIQC